MPATEVAPAHNWWIRGGERWLSMLVDFHHGGCEFAEKDLKTLRTIADVVGKIVREQEEKTKASP